MGGFVFRLAKVLRYREHLEKAARQRLRKAREECALGERALMDMNLKRDLTEECCARQEEQGMEVAAYQLYRAFIEQISRKIEGANQSLEEAKEAVRAMERAWLKASSNKKSLDNLRERQFLGYGEVQAREEQKLLDELVILRRGLR